MASTWQYWSDNSGDTYAVLVAEDGTPLQASTALHFREVTQANLDAGFEAVDVEPSWGASYRMEQPPYAGDNDWNPASDVWLATQMRQADIEAELDRQVDADEREADYY